MTGSGSSVFGLFKPEDNKPAKEGFGENAFVTSGTSLDIIGNKGIFLDKGAVLQSKLEDGSKNHTSLVSEHGDIRLGENSVVQGQTAYIRTGDESGVGGGSIELGDNSHKSARETTSA